MSAPFGSVFHTKNETALRSLKSINQSKAHLDIVLRFKFTVRTAVCVFSTTIYRLMTFANRRIEHFIFVTISVIK